MLKFFHGNQLETLADRLIEELDENPPDNLLAPEIFVVQNHGIGQWLSIYMARHEGVAANLEFEFPSERIWKLIRLIDPDIPQTLPSDRQPMTWSLMSLLDDEEFLAEFDNLHRYIKDDNPVRQSVRKWKLATKIADVFDQYLIYRHEMILGWENDELEYASEAEIWQKKMWNRLLNYWIDYYDDNWFHRAQLQDQLLTHLDTNAFTEDELPDRISIFGVSSMPPAFIESIIKLSELVDVYIYQLTVDPEVNGSEDFVNPLLQSLGKQGADFVDHFIRRSDQMDIPLQVEEVGESDPDKESAFQTVHSDLKEDNPVAGRLQQIPTADATIQVHSCHSPMREVEVLYDQLLAAFDENPDLNPDDVLIMTPDIETYAPMIEAIFEMPDEGQPEIPYSIADRGIRQSNAAIQSFLKILELAESRFKVTDVLDLLDASPIQEAFEFTDDDLNRLDGWIADNRIRWGVDAPFKQSLNVPESGSFTWKSGLNRMLLGYAVKQEDDLLHNGIFPYSEIETSDDAVLTGKFSRFLHSLFQLSKETTTHRTPREWGRYLNQILDTFLPKGREYFRQVSQIRDAVEQLKNDASLGNYRQDLPFRIMRSWLEDQLEEQSTGGGRIGQGVTFSSLVPMRSIPFKMIGMIGMNEGAFPRSSIPIAFDLMHLEPRSGDPIRSEEDRHLFLDNLLSARSHIYFSYVGQSNRQDSEFPPSVILKEFLDYLEVHYGLKSEDLIQKHRLQAFSTSYFKDDGLFSFSKTQQKISEQLMDGRTNPSKFMSKSLPPPEEDWKQLSVNDLISFFQHPAKFLLRNRLGIYLRDEDALTEDREPFGLSGLDEYKVGQELLNRYIKDDPLDSYKKILESRDLLPEGWSGQQAYHQKVKEVQDFGAAITEVLEQQSLEDCEVDIEVGEFRVVGSLSNIYQDEQISYRFGRMRAKDLIDLWIRHLLFQLVKPELHPGYSSLFTRDKKKPFAQYQLSPLDNAKPILADFLDVYWKGLQRRIYFLPESSFAYGHEVYYRGGNEKSGLKKASYEWDRNYGQYRGEIGDPYNKLILGTENPLKSDQFKEVAALFWAPFFDVLNQGVQ